jgi:phytoene synthase
MNGSGQSCRNSDNSCVQTLLPPRRTQVAVRRLTQKRAANFRYAFYRLPADQRLGMESIYAFARRADDAVDDPGTAAERTARLHELRRGLDATFTGAPPDEYFEALRWAVDRFSISREPFQLILEGCAWDLENQSYGTFEAVYGYCYRVAAAVGLACLPVWGVKAAEAEGPAVALGIGMQWVNILRDVREDAALGRCYLPQEELARAGLNRELLRADAAMTDATRAALADFLGLQCRRAAEFLDRGAALLDYVPAASRHCPRLLRGFYRELLTEIGRDPLQVLSRRVRLGVLTKWRLFWQAGKK